MRNTYSKSLGRLLALLATVIVLGSSNQAFCDDATLCVWDSSHPLLRGPSLYLGKSSKCRAGFTILSLRNGLTEQDLDKRLQRPIGGVPYEFHLVLSGYMEATGWLIMESGGAWKGRLRISWKDQNGQRHEEGSTTYDMYMGGYERGQVSLANEGNAFAWFEPRSRNDSTPVFFAAWSNGNQRICSKLDLFDQTNTLEWFNVPDATLNNRCPIGFKPPEWLLSPHFGPPREF